MNLLLDTWAFICWDSGGVLSSAAMTALQDPANRLYLSHASIWEMQIKHQNGKLFLHKPLSEIIDDQCRQNGLILLSVDPPDTYELSQLPYHHTDPVDRLIISQAKRRGYTVVTEDGDFKEYDVPVLW